MPMQIGLWFRHSYMPFGPLLSAGVPITFLCLQTDAMKCYSSYMQGLQQRMKGESNIMAIIGQEMEYICNQ